MLIGKTSGLEEPGNIHLKFNIKYNYGTTLVIKAKVLKIRMGKKKKKIRMGYCACPATQNPYDSDFWVLFLTPIT